MIEKNHNTIQQNYKIPVSVVFLGPPASGKGTTASFLENNFGIKPVSPGNIFKQIRNEKSELSDLVIETTKNGGLCPDWLTNKIVKDESEKIIKKGAKSISLDGYPRTLEQLNFLNKNFSVKLFVYASTDLEKLKVIVDNRRNCKSCNKVFSCLHNFECDNSNKDFCAKFSDLNWEKRWDDSSEFFHKRFEVYKSETLPVIDEVSRYENFIELDLFDLESQNKIQQLI